MMLRALEESERIKKREEEEEAELIKQAIAAIAKEEGTDTVKPPFEAPQEAVTTTEPVPVKEEPKPEPPKVEPPAAIIKAEEEKQPEPKEAAVTLPPP